MRKTHSTSVTLLCYSSRFTTLIQSIVALPRVKCVPQIVAGGADDEIVTALRKLNDLAAILALH